MTEKKNNNGKIVLLGAAALIVAIAATTMKKEPSPISTAEATPSAKQSAMVKTVQTNAKPEITFFTQDGCSYCKMARDFIDREYPTLPVNVINVGTRNGYKKLQAEAKARNFTNIGTPFILLGKDKYIMGWGEANIAAFKKYADSFTVQKK